MCNIWIVNKAMSQGFAHLYTLAIVHFTLIAECKITVNNK